MPVNYVLQRLLYMVVTLFLLSAAVFAIIQLPEGDYADFVVNSLRTQSSDAVLGQEQEALIRGPLRAGQTADRSILQLVRKRAQR